ncbi:histidine phosphatase family protein [Roseobacter sp. HKCCA0434]|uniref:histidine phosphatase family protein n=1 Tax=Roseobacter sp. HKCCA0434 TaxID=3079297 RepID=UPI002905BAC3|nr:histidine phosphatase family protein [Roseobacter sp. HKCCA0434]
MTVDWWWVRHGPTHAARMVGQTDIAADLSDTARIGRLAKALPQGATVLSSDLRRAVATARALGLDPVPEPRLREFDYGRWEDLAFDDPAVDADLARRFWDEPGDVAPPGGESWNELSARVRTVVAEHRGPGPIVAVAHMGVILAALAHATGMPAKSALSFRIAPLSLTRLSWHGGADWSVACVNHEF